MSSTTTLGPNIQIAAGELALWFAKEKIGVPNVVSRSHAWCAYRRMPKCAFCNTWASGYRKLGWPEFRMTIFVMFISAGQTIALLGNFKHPGFRLNLSSFWGLFLNVSLRETVDRAIKFSCVNSELPLAVGSNLLCILPLRYNRVRVYYYRHHFYCSTCEGSKF